MYAITGLIIIHVIDSSGPKSEVFSAGTLWARLFSGPLEGFYRAILEQADSLEWSN
jgi:hypothetical protein